MNITEIKQKIENGAFDKDFTMLYGDVKAPPARVTAPRATAFAVFSPKETAYAFSLPPAELR